MHLIILPGNSKEYNEQWLYDSAEAYKTSFESVTTHVYKHWEDGTETAHINEEIKKLEKEVKELKGDYVILAKSVGTIITVKAVVAGEVAPSKCVFVGSPWKNFTPQQENNNSELTNFRIPTLFIQQSDDMFFKFSELKQVINNKKFRDFKLIEIPGNNHAYDNYDEIRGWMKTFLSV